ncbi:MAG TPA: hypothetical protein PKZ32_11020, partial [Candidatus Melainabacteria bacterium]|nr:hypothetical protein [Candidatus Melainabacteria bacterium]
RGKLRNDYPIVSDRAKSGNLKFPLAQTLSDYTPIPDPRKVEPQPDSKAADSKETTKGKEASGSRETGAEKTDN